VYSLLETPLTVRSLSMTYSPARSIIGTGCISSISDSLSRMPFI
jgi:hypothetical protein